MCYRREVLEKTHLDKLPTALIDTIDCHVELLEVRQYYKERYDLIYHLHKRNPLNNIYIDSRLRPCINCAERCYQDYIIFCSSCMAGFCSKECFDNSWHYCYKHKLLDYKKVTT